MAAVSPTYGANPFGLARSCVRCPALRSCGPRVVHGFGRPGAEVMFVGAAPTPGHADQAVPFPGGEGGRRLAWLLRTIGLAHDAAPPGDPTTDGVGGRAIECFVTNAVRCATPGRRPPRRSEREACADWLAEEILRVDPTVIVPMGSHAGRAVFDLLLGEPFPGVGDAHGGAWHRHGYRVHPMAHVLRLPAEDLRSVAQSLVRVVVHARPEHAGHDDTAGALGNGRAERLLFRCALARRVADARARRVAGGGPARGALYWSAYLNTLADVLLGTLRHVRARPGVTPAVRVLGVRGDDVYAVPTDAARPTADLHDGLGFDRTPRGVYEYWLYHHHVWSPAESDRYEVIHRDARLLARFDPDVARRLVPVAERRRLLPTRVSLTGDEAELTVVLRDRRAERPTIRIDRLRIGLADGRVRFLDREERSCDPAPVLRPRFGADDPWDDEPPDEAALPSVASGA